MEGSDLQDKPLTNKERYLFCFNICPVYEPIDSTAGQEVPYHKQIKDFPLKMRIIIFSEPGCTVAQTLTPARFSVT